MTQMFDEIPSGFRLYIKRPIPVKAIQVNDEFYVITKEGIMQGKPGDYLIEGVEGELYCCDKKIFEKTYKLLKKGKINKTVSDLSLKEKE